MALMKCKECGKDISEKVDKCPNCGAPTKQKTSCLGMLGLIIVGFIIVVILNNLFTKTKKYTPPPTNTKPSAAVPSFQKIPYKVVEKKPIPNGGYKMAVVIASQYKNEKDMKAFGQNLWQDTKQDRNAFIWVYDSDRAAQLSTNALAGNLNKADMAYHDSHMVGQYTRNGNTGYHSIVISLQGIQGPTTEVKY